MLIKSGGGNGPMKLQQPFGFNQNGAKSCNVEL